jgi:hypothetical protein
MTGGIGFSRFGQQASEENRKLKSSSRSIKDHPYLLSSAKPSYVEKEFQERKAWQKAYIRQAKRRQFLVFLVLFFLSLALFITIYLI